MGKLMNLYHKIKKKDQAKALPKSADETFESLGFIRTINRDDTIKYKWWLDDRNRLEVIFDIDRHEVLYQWLSLDDLDLPEKVFDANDEILEAIDKKKKEIGWDDQPEEETDGQIH